MFAGRRLWKQLRRKYKINYDKVVIFLPEENPEWNYYALAYLNDFRLRKGANEAIVFAADDQICEMAKKMHLSSTTVRFMSGEQMKVIMKYYCFDKFFDNARFFYFDFPRDNNNSRILEKSNVTKEEIVCLAFYCLRQMPEIRHPFTDGGHAYV